MALPELTVRIFCAGLYFATSRAVRPVTVKTMMRAALILSAARTADEARASAYTGQRCAGMSCSLPDLGRWTGSRHGLVLKIVAKHVLHALV